MKKDIKRIIKSIAIVILIETVLVLFYPYILNYVAIDQMHSSIDSSIWIQIVRDLYSIRYIAYLLYILISNKKEIKNETCKTFR